MTPAISAITIVLAIVGAISLGVWCTLAVQYFINKNKLSADQIENRELRKYLIEVKEDRSQLNAEIMALQTKYDDQTNSIVAKLLSK